MQKLDTLKELHAEAEQLHATTDNIHAKDALAQGLSVSGVNIDLESTDEQIEEALAYLHTQLEKAMRLEEGAADTLRSGELE